VLVEESEIADKRARERQHDADFNGHEVGKADRFGTSPEPIRETVLHVSAGRSAGLT
jgi:hypothetical protein